MTRAIDEIKIRFRHGLGDCTYAVHQLQMYLRQNFKVVVDCDPDKRALFEAFGIVVEHNDTFEEVAWDHAPRSSSIEPMNYWRLNKAFYNLGRRPLPEINLERAELFNEFSRTELRIGSWLASNEREAVAEVKTFFRDLPRPIVLLHTKGNSFQEVKSLPDSACLPLYRALLDTLAGTLILLDWDNRVPRASSYRLRHLLDDRSARGQTIHKLLRQPKGRAPVGQWSARQVGQGTDNP